MNKREFLQKSGALVGGTLVGARASTAQESSRFNWARNYRYQARRLHSPKTTEELIQIVRGNRHLKALGTRHSFNAIADDAENQVSMEHFNGIAIDAKAGTATVGAGVPYGRLAPVLEERGFALHNLASLPHISVAGACATGTHGSGNENGNLSTAVTALEMVTAAGQVVTLSRESDPEKFRGAVVNLGGLGIVTKVTLKLMPTYRVQQVVYQNLPLAELDRHFDEIFSRAWSVSLFTDWQKKQIAQVWVKTRLGAAAEPPAPNEWFSARLATKRLHPLADHSAENCTEQIGIAGPWYERLPHFRMDFTPSSGEELQAEYFVPREKGLEAIHAIERIGDQVAPHLFISELRTIAADDLWMSPCYQRPALAIHFTLKPDWPAVRTLLPKIEQQLAPFGARPHWGKLFTIDPARLRSLYEKLPAYRSLANEYDPEGKFRNQFLTANLFG